MNDISSLLPTLFLIGVGGALGSCIRHYAAEVMKKRTSFPAGILIVNIVGTFLAAFVFFIPILPPFESFIFTTGFLGGLTTFSTFSYDNLQLLEQKKIFRFVLNIGANIILSLIGIFVCYSHFLN